ncbi:MAG: radical SAM protein [Pseudomonadota bacterium]
MAVIALIGSEIEENLSLRYLSSAAGRHGHRVRIIPFNGWTDLDRVAGEVLALNPEIAGLSMAFQARGEEFMSLAEKLRCRGFEGHVIAGGHFATFACDDILNTCLSIDSIAKFNGEAALSALARIMDRGGDWKTAPGIVFRDEANKGRIDSNPPPAGARMAMEENIWPDRCGRRRSHLFLKTAPVIGSQGCWGSCNFCCIHAFRKFQGRKGTTFREIDDLAREMAFLYREHDVRVFVFQDDNLFLASQRRNVLRMAGLKSALAREGVDTASISIGVKSRPETISAPLLESLRELGTVRVFLGVESMSQRGLDVLGRGLSVERNFEAMRLLDEHDFFPCYNILLINPWSTLDEISENIENLKKAPAHFPFNVCRTEIYHGTPLYEKLRGERRLMGSFLKPNYEVADPTVEVFFRIMEAGFGHRSFDFHGSINEAMALGYDVSLARRHYGDAAGILGIAEKAREAIEQTNANTLELLEELRDFVSVVPRLKDDVEAFALDFAMRTAGLEQSELRHIGDIKGQLVEKVRRRISGKQEKRKRKLLGQIASYTAIPVMTLALGGASCNLPKSLKGTDDRDAAAKVIQGEADAGTPTPDVKRSTSSVFKTEFFPSGHRYEAELPKFNKAFLLLEHKKGGIPQGTDIRVKASPSIRVASLVSPDRARIMLELGPAKKVDAPQKAPVTIELLEGGKVVASHQEIFWAYTDGEFSHGEEKLDLSRDVRVNDPVALSTLSFDLTIEKNVDILFFEQGRGPFFPSNFSKENSEMTFSFDTAKGYRVLAQGLELTTEVHLEKGQTIVDFELSASEGKIERMSDYEGIHTFKWLIPTGEDGKRLKAGTFTIDAVYTVKGKKKKATKLKGRATLKVEEDGDLVIENITMKEKPGSPWSARVKSLPRNLYLSLGLLEESADRAVFRPRLHRGPLLSGSKEGNGNLQWNMTGGTLEHLEDGRVVWYLPKTQGMHRLTCWAKDDTGALSLASHFSYRS